MSCNIYFNVISKDNTFQIVESPKEPQGSALSTLQNIQEVIKEILANQKTSNPKPYEYFDGDKKVTDDEFINSLKERVSKITTEYNDQVKEINGFIRNTSGICKNLYDVKITNDAIQNDNAPLTPIPGLGDLPTEIFEQIGEYLPITVWANLAQVSREGEVQSSYYILRRASEFGYEGKDPKEAASYLKRLFEFVEEEYKIYKHNKSGSRFPKPYLFFPHKYLSFKINPKTRKETVDREQTLKNLKAITSAEIVDSSTMTAATWAIGGKSTKLMEAFKCFLRKNQKPDPSTPPEVKKKAQECLDIKIFTASESSLPSLSVMEIALLQGANPTNCILQNAIDKGLVDTVVLLLKNGADEALLIQNASKSSKLLMDAVERNNPQIVELLLKNGADSNICNNYGRPLLYLAIKKGCRQVVKLLLQHGAKTD